MKTNILKLIGVQTLLLFAVLLFGGSNANAVVDTCTWTSGGTGTVDSGLNTITYNVNDTSNWNCSIDGAAVPEAGDTLEFPANLAEVDPGDSLTNDDQWRYIVNNDLPANTSFAGIMFTGDAGTNDCQVNNDGYKLEGAAIQLTGDVTSTLNNCNMPELNLDIEAMSDLTFGANLGYDATLTHSVNTIRFDGLHYPWISGAVNGTGTIEVGRSSLSLRDTSVIGNAITVLEDNNISVNLPSVINKASMIITLQTGATITITSNEPANNEFLPSLVFVGAGGASSYGVSNDYTVPAETVQGYRGYISGNEYNFQTEKTTYFEITLSGDITLSNNSVFRIDSNVEISGDLSGNYTVGIMPGSRGNLTISSANNDSATANGTIERSRVDYALTDVAFDIYISAAYNGILDPDEPLTTKVFVRDDARLQGTGEVAGLEVQAGGVVAPGESPGCIVSDGDLTLNGTYEFEIDTATACTGYDQIDVTGAVDITGATLELSLLDGYSFDVEEEFILINNDGSDDVTGTFTGLDEGDTITVDGNDFEISYVGGDGNDVSVLAISISENNAAAEEAPGAPDTGVGSLMQNPFVTLSAAILAAGVVVGLRKVQSSRN